MYLLYSTLTIDRYNLSFVANGCLSFKTHDGQINFKKVHIFCLI